MKAIGGQDRRDPADPRVVLAELGLRAKKSWGQNFLIDRRVHARIVEAVAAGPDDTVVEIGAGLGTLTQALLGNDEARPRRIIAIEREAAMVAVLRRAFGGNAAVDVEAADAVGFDYAACARAAGRPLVVVGNLPYQISSALIFSLLAAKGAVARAVVMVQKEFAQRAIAPPGNKIYGRLSVMLQQSAEARLIFQVSPSAFVPQPKVMSAVLRIVPRPTSLAPVDDAQLFADVVRAGFGARRKTLRRSLGTAFGDRTTESALALAAVDGQRRPETLAVAEWARLTNALGEKGAAHAGAA